MVEDPLSCIDLKRSFGMGLHKFYSDYMFNWLKIQIVNINHLPATSQG